MQRLLIKKDKKSPQSPIMTKIERLSYSQLTGCRPGFQLIKIVK